MHSAPAFILKVISNKVPEVEDLLFIQKSAVAHESHLLFQIALSP